jgi:hypothetical protein
MAPKYTPRPWMALGFEIVAEGIGVIASVCARAIRAIPPEERRGNVSLMAGSVDMYEALVALVNAHDEQPPMLTDREWQQARAAIRQATEGK